MEHDSPRARRAGETEGDGDGVTDGVGEEDCEGNGAIGAPVKDTHVT